MPCRLLFAAASPSPTFTAAVAYASSRRLFHRATPTRRCRRKRQDYLHCFRFDLRLISEILSPLLSAGNLSFKRGGHFSTPRTLGAPPHAGLISLPVAPPTYDIDADGLRCVSRGLCATPIFFALMTPDARFTRAAIECFSRRKEGWRCVGQCAPPAAISFDVGWSMRCLFCLPRGAILAAIFSPEMPPTMAADILFSGLREARAQIRH